MEKNRRDKEEGQRHNVLAPEKHGEPVKKDREIKTERRGINDDLTTKPCI